MLRRSAQAAPESPTHPKLCAVEFVVMKDVFATVLHGRIALAARAAKDAHASGNPVEAEDHTTRLADLLALAAQHDVTLGPAETAASRADTGVARAP